MPSDLHASASVRVPATSANLGPGFDAFGLALSLADDVTARVTADGLSVRATGYGSDLPADESHLVVRAMRAAFARLDAEPAGLALECTNRIPHGRGLGSSAAAIVGGLVLARALVVGGDERLPDPELLALATRIEGHPDNVAACLLGGFTIAWTEPAGPSAVRLDVDRRITPVVFVPPFEASTEMARGLLPASVPHVDAAFSAGRAGLLVAALTGRVDALLAATDDRLHQAYRAPAMSASADLVSALRGEQLPAVISGAGPTVLVLAASADECEAAERLTPDGWTVSRPSVPTTGATATVDTVRAS